MDTQIILITIISALVGKEGLAWYKQWSKNKSQQKQESIKHQTQSTGNVQSILTQQIEDTKTELIECRILNKSNTRITELEIKLATMRERLLGYTLHSRGAKGKKAKTENS